MQIDEGITAGPQGVSGVELEDAGSGQYAEGSAEGLLPGDVVLFARLTLSQAWRSEGLRGLLTWLGHWIIALCSQYTEGLYDGYWELVHAGIVVEHDAALRLMEFTINGNGMQLDEVHRRIRGYPGAVLVMPLAARYRANWVPSSVAVWISAHRDWKYRWGGLPFAILHSHLGWRLPGRMFCSEAVVALLTDLHIIPDQLWVWKGSRVGMKPVKPQGYAPCEVARLPQLKRSRGYAARTAPWYAAAL